MSFSLRATVGFLSLMLIGCQSSLPPRAIERLALLPFENLTGDRSLDWLGRGAQVVLNRQLAVSHTVAATAYPASAEAVLGRATRIVHGTIEKRSGEVVLGAFLEDGVTHRQSGDRVELRVPPEQVLTGLNRLAKILAADASAPPATQLAALEALVAAQMAPQPEAKFAALAKAAELDPQFALPLLGLAELSISTGKREQAQAALTAAGTRQLDVIERQQVLLLTANLSKDRAAQAQALQKLADASPTQPQLQIMAATLLTRLRQYAPVTAAYERALKVDPDNGDLWNRLGYANAYLGRLPAARQAIETYQRLEPAEPNPLDSLGEVHYLAGQFKPAAQYFQTAFTKLPQFDGARTILKAAYARLLDGQFDQADQALATYLQVTNGAPPAQVARAHFLYASGKRAEGVKALADAAGQATGPLAALYQTHRCGLLLATDRAGAATAARAAMAAGASPPAVLCYFVSQPSVSPAEWTARANQAFPAPQMEAFRRQALAYALFFDGHFYEATPAIEALMLETSPEADSELRAWLAECQWRTGRWPSARETITRWPLPAADSIFAGRQVPVFLEAILKVAERHEDAAVMKRWVSVSSKVLR